MALPPGARLGPYEILSPLGSGGMGEVYRARDLKLNRDVALKVLPDSVARDADHLARFQREAQVLASLNHPNIAQIHGLEESDGSCAIVMELVEGSTLAEIIQGQRVGPPGLPINDALPVARQIAEALEAAHDLGVIHRDLKPANVKVRTDGAVKVLDFGLAKAFDVAPATGAGLTNSPTLSLHPTYAGLILGTAAYMSPEQAAGKTVDRRTDIWSFGVVLWEMLTGKRLFDGETISHTLADVLRAEIDFSQLPAETPSPIQDLVRRCLDRDVKRRLRDIGEARVAIDRAIAEPKRGGADADKPADRANPNRTGRAMRALPWAIAAVAISAVVTPLVLWPPWRANPPVASARLAADVGADVSLLNLGASLAMSRDGTLLAFAAQAGGNRQLYLRKLGQLQATALAGTDDATDPFFSPDGQWLAFFAGGKLKKVSVTGGSPITLCDAAQDRGGAWLDDGTIVFQPSGLGSPLVRVSSAGGTPQPAAKLTEDEKTQRWPDILPGGKSVVYTSHTTQADFDQASVAAIDLTTGARKVIQRTAYFGRYLASGHLLYVHEQTIFAAPFDPAHLELTGPAVPVLEGVVSGPSGVGRNGGAQLAVSSTGLAVYLQGESFTGVPVEIMDRSGRLTPLTARRALWSSPEFSPDGRRLALEIVDGAQFDVWILDVARDALSRITFDPAEDNWPIWTPDGTRIAFASRRADKVTMVANLYWQRADGTGEPQRLTQSPISQRPGSWHPSGKYLAFTEATPQSSGGDLMVLPMEGDETSGWKPGQPFEFLKTAFDEQNPVFSPDGRLIAYASNESGRMEIYVRPFPGPGGKWQVSVGGGGLPTWSRTKREILFEDTQQRIMVASYTMTGDSFVVDKPRLWSEQRLLRARGRNFALAPDGDHIVMASETVATSGKQSKLVFVSNFFDELRRLAPPKK